MQTLYLWQHSAEQSASWKVDESNRKKEGGTLRARRYLGEVHPPSRKSRQRCCC